MAVGGWRRGWQLIVSTLRIFRRYPLFIVPIIIVWLIYAPIIIYLKYFFPGKEEFNAENVAKTLADYREFSLSRAFIKALEKGIRMIVFLILPAIAWEDLGFVEAIKKGLGVLRSYLAEFASGYALTYAAAVIVFLPPAIIRVTGETADELFL